MTLQRLTHYHILLVGVTYNKTFLGVTYNKTFVGVTYNKTFVGVTYNKTQQIRHRKMNTYIVLSYIKSI